MSVAEARTAGTCSARRTPEARLVGLRRAEPARLGDQIDVLYRAARAMCGSAEGAEELVQATIARVQGKRHRFRRSDADIGQLLRAADIGHLLRALRTTFIGRGGVAEPGPEERLPGSDVYRTIASLPEDARDALIAVDLMGLSYGEAARALRVRVATITSRLHFGRQRVADML
jgi:RNA polymerase sigma-70 factor (ECF subfamily)